MPQVERLYLQVMLPVSLLVLAAILTFNVAVEKRIKAKVKYVFLLIHPQMLKSGKLSIVLLGRRLFALFQLLHEWCKGAVESRFFITQCISLFQPSII